MEKREKDHTLTELWADIAGTLNKHKASKELFVEVYRCIQRAKEKNGD